MLNRQAKCTNDGVRCTSGRSRINKGPAAAFRRLFEALVYGSLSISQMSSTSEPPTFAHHHVRTRSYDNTLALSLEVLHDEHHNALYNLNRKSRMRRVLPLAKRQDVDA